MSFVLSGIDWGGLRREWFELLCKALFSHDSGFFTRFNAEDPQALVRTQFSDHVFVFTEVSQNIENKHIEFNYWRGNALTWALFP